MEGFRLKGKVYSFVLVLASLLILTLVFAQDTSNADANDLTVLHLGDKTITQSEFNTRFEALARATAARQGLPVTEQTLALFDSFRTDYLEQLSTELVLLNEANKRGLSVSDEALNTQIADMKAQFPDEVTYMQALEQAGFADEASLKVAMHDSETVQAVIEELAKEINIDEAAVQAWYQDNQSELEQPAEVCALHILVEDEATAQSIAQDIKDGADFGVLAEEHSLDAASAAKGGDLGCFAAGVMVPAFETSAFSLTNGEISEPIQTQFGYHIIKVYDRHDAQTPAFETVKEQIHTRLQAEALNKRIEELRQASAIEVFPENVMLARPEMTE